MKRGIGVLVGVFAVCLSLPGCGGNSSTGPTGNNAVAGNYSGSLQSSYAGAGTMFATIAQSGSSLSGTWGTATALGNNSGSLSGTASGSTVSLRATPSNPLTCPFNATATFDGRVLTGTYAAFNCSVADGGTFSLAK